MTKEDMIQAAKEWIVEETGRDVELHGEYMNWFAFRDTETNKVAVITHNVLENQFEFARTGQPSDLIQEKLNVHRKIRLFVL